MIQYLQFSLFFFFIFFSSDLARFKIHVLNRKYDIKASNEFIFRFISTDARNDY